ncbi:hypothetical protein J4E91_008136 [Alternaria rosae]|nr:hypothetical protein J4E91_008136 [Alternaria rosae]
MSDGKRSSGSGQSVAITTEDPDDPRPQPQPQSQPQSQPQPQPQSQSQLQPQPQIELQTEPQPQPEWSANFQRYLITLWNAQYGRYYWQHYIEAFYVRGSAFFEEGKVFAVLFTEPAGPNALNGLNPMADYNTNLSIVKYDDFVRTQVRRFIVTKRRREFCFAVYALLYATCIATWLIFGSPIFTYYGQATTKNGVVADEHAIAYSLEMEPQLVSGEAPLLKAPIPIVTEENNKPLVPASRIYFACHHPIQYNVKVKNLGHVHPDYLPTFLGYWNQENTDSKQDIDVTGD